MRKIKNSYSPGFFYMTIDSSELLHGIIGSPNEASFIHEYIHLLQDISLYSSRWYLWQKVNRFRDIADTIRVAKQKQRRPIIPMFQNSIVNKKLVDEIWGTGTVLGNEWNITKIEIIETECEKGILREKVTLLLSDGSNVVRYHLGYIDFVENMACIIEEHLFGSQSLPRFPYHTIQKVLEYYKKYFDVNIISEICELSLSFYDPIIPFLRFLRNDRTNNTEEIKNAMFEGMKVAYLNGQIENMKQSFNRIFSESKEMLLDCYKSTLFTDLSIWINKILEHGKAFRESNDLFLSNILLGRATEAKRKIFGLTIKTGIPLIINSNNDCQIVSTEFQGNNTYSLIALDELFEYLQDYRLNCNLEPLCERADEKTGSKLVTPECDFNILWKTKQSELCPIAQWIKTFGINNFE